MKTRIVGTVLCFNFEEEKFNKLSSICAKTGNKIKSVDKSDFDKPVGSLVGFNVTPEEYKEINFDGELMLLYNFQSGDLNKFLRTIRQNEIEVPLKAMLTETNKTWLPIKLYEQIKEEHIEMTKGKSNE